MAITFSMAIGAATSKTDFADETLHYIITYKWGLIHKEAATATLSLRRQGDNYNLKLTAKTKPWADKFFEVRDTLGSRVQARGFLPLSYTKIAHEGGKYSKDDITYHHSNGGKVGASCMRYREKKGKITKSNTTLSGSGPVYDMLSVFYYLRLLDFNSFTNGKVMRITVFSGLKSETLAVKSSGIETIKMQNGAKRNAWHIRFTFTSDGKKKSSDDIDAWISDDTARIPLMLVGKLPVGQVRVYLV